MGLELPYLIREIPNERIASDVVYAVLIAVAILLIRIARVFIKRSNLKRAFVSGKGFVSGKALLDL